jgi:hypothetical protein
MNFAKKISAPFKKAFGKPFQKRKDHDLFMGCALNGAWSVMKEILQRRPEAVTWRDEKGMTALHHAAGFGAFTFMEYLIERGADIEAADRKGLRALHHAAKSADKNAGATVAVLLKQGANIEACHRGGTRPLLYAMLHNRPAQTEILAAAGADAGAANATAHTAEKEAILMKKARPQIYAALKRGLSAHQSDLRATEETLRKKAIAEAIESMGSGLAADMPVMKPVRLVK